VEEYHFKEEIKRTKPKKNLKKNTTPTLGMKASSPMGAQDVCYSKRGNKKTKKRCEVHAIGLKLSPATNLFQYAGSWKEKVFGGGMKKRNKTECAPKLQLL